MGTRQQVAAHSLSDVEHGLADHADGDQVVHCRVRVARREHAVAQLRGVEVVEAEFHRRIYLAHQDLVRRKLIVLRRRRPANGHVATIVLDRALAGLGHARKRRHPTQLRLSVQLKLLRYRRQSDGYYANRSNRALRLRSKAKRTRKRKAGQISGSSGF